MTIWSRLGGLLAAIGNGGASLLDRLISAIAGDPAHRRAVAFSIAVVALSAKMAKADGVVTADEVAAFRAYFQVEPHEEAHVRRLFELAQADVAGYDHYAERIATLFADEPALRQDVLEGLFLIAAADGYVHADELTFLEHVAGILGLEERDYVRIRARHVRIECDDPYAVLGVARETDVVELKVHYRRLVREHHPDRFMARGVPPEFAKIANDRLAAINAAWSQIALERGL